ncbi:DUF2975 domain-containing protein [Clostridium hydrogenum]|uniref:DUF2975 domain-containing protein n=1 Tax=Clostridium hydrogenum TaxID=2855764 RepID=UPI001F1E2960|nr:DUF2975 domain-containing protein [Clostridium hydrogenum]
MDNSESVCKFLRACLSLLMILTFLFFITISIITFSNESLAHAITYTFIRALVFGTFLFLLYDLRNIVCTIINRNPFSEKNIKKFKNISKCIFFLGIVSIIDHPKNSPTIFDFFGFSINASIFIYIILGCLSLILAEIFKLALKIKTENDLTI